MRALRWGKAEDIANPTSQGASPAIVLLHGLGDGADIWRPMLRAWPSEGPAMPILALDLPGHGGSAHIAADRYRLSELAAIVSAALVRLSITRPVLIGHSLGARVALALGSERLVQPRATLLIDWSPEDKGLADAAVAEHVDALIAGAPDLHCLIDLVYARLPLAQPDAVREVVTAMARATGRGWQVPLDPQIKALLQSSDDATDHWMLLRSVPGPIGIVRGAYSSMLSKPVAERMAAATRLPAAVETVQGAGHAIPLEQPAVLAGVLERMVVRLALPFTHKPG